MYQLQGVKLQLAYLELAGMKRSYDTPTYPFGAIFDV